MDFVVTPCQVYDPHELHESCCRVQLHPYGQMLVKGLIMRKLTHHMVQSNGDHLQQGCQELTGDCMAWVPPCTCTTPPQTPRCSPLTWATGRISVSCLPAPAATQHLALIQTCQVSPRTSPCSHHIRCPLRMLFTTSRCAKFKQQCYTCSRRGWTTQRCPGYDASKSANAPGASVQWLWVAWHAPAAHAKSPTVSACQPGSQLSCQHGTSGIGAVLYHGQSAGCNLAREQSLA